MKLKINYAKKTNEIKDAFHNLFPYLKLEFFKASHQSGEPSHKDAMFDRDLPLEYLNPLIKEHTITITGSQTVHELEELFKKEFDLNVQVFRKQGNVWIETTHTDPLTLDKQNDMGESNSVVKTVSAESYFSESIAY